MGTIAIVQRTVAHHAVGDTARDHAVTTVDEGDFCPHLQETASIEVLVSVPRRPFQGHVELSVSRRTDTPDVYERVAVLRAELPDPSPETTVFFIWDGRATQDVPRHYSDRTLRNLNQDIMVNIPVRELRSGDIVHHGVYVVTRIAPFEKDGSVAGDLRLTVEEQNKYALVTQPLVELILADRATGPGSSTYQPLLDVGFGESPTTVPFVPQFEIAVHRAVESYFPVFHYKMTPQEANSEIFVAKSVRRIRFVRTIEREVTQGLKVGIDLSSARAAQAMAEGQTYTNLRKYAEETRGNLFAWADDDSTPLIRSSMTWALIFLRNMPSKPKEGRDGLALAFGPIGFQEDSYWDPKHWTYAEQDDIYPKPILPRTIDGGEVTGAVTLLDEANVKTDLGLNGMLIVTSTNLEVVPTTRAADIQRAFCAVVGFISEVVAHELGHLLGIIGQDALGDPTGGIVMPDGTLATPTLQQNSQGHDLTFTPEGLMVSGDDRPFQPTLRLLPPTREFTPDQSAYLSAIFPVAREMTQG